MEVNPEYAEAAKAVERAHVRCGDFFQTDWPRTLAGLEDPVLVIGNPPWVTNSAMGRLGGDNLPGKSNFQRFRGLDAITGKSNFDISESMLVHLLECLSGRRAAVAMLCKTVVARKVLRHAWSRHLQVARSSVYAIDAKQYFGASVDACLLVCLLEPGRASQDCAVYADLDERTNRSTFALRDGELVADLEAADTYGHLRGPSPLKWRSGVKHDCAGVMELRSSGKGEFENGLGETVSLEGTYLYPALKSSDLTRPRPVPSRYMLVTQRSVGQDTSRIRRDAPRTWKYLLSHADRLDARASSIYRNRPRFSVFGVGPYSFAPWKVATSGFYKRLDFRCVGPVADRPVVLDDTCYFLPCQTERDARTLAGLLNSEPARGFFGAFVFWDAKRPITAQLLSRLDLHRLAGEAGVSLPVWADPRQFTLFGV
ncbi:SAM-dependent DNA methyltransferase [Candidatus Palauibacter sp.]|uniref:SAM-dependent DNA methyltransferase n=1 Tax=Candidatus Palauibacter sp. TaxID=3101350 RepID=UPI003B594FB9